MHEPVFRMYPVIVNPTKNHVSLLVKCQNDIDSFTRAFTGVNFRPYIDKRSGVMIPGSRKLPKVGGGGCGLCMVIILKIFKMKEKMPWRDA